VYKINEKLLKTFNEADILVEKTD